ncbi:hypothetical protein [Spirosoma pollinicola]|uniref:Uncharacterized protein n=1 Tax=Spirosoma pollinicola TaxID=2057025 RepID=A0A2K8ZAZ0_9BACT|nr:hypothetical protein [Spirosoma pollinicola]AUD07025.1 hypothetical protein CWM47_37510 [Spirosoma pollinicola]
MDELSLFDPKNVFYERDGWHYLTENYIKLLLRYELIIDVSAGGLVIAPSHAEGGINLISPIPTGEVAVTAEIEGGEYLVNAFAAHAYHDEIERIDSAFPNKAMPFEPYLLPEGTTIIDGSRKNIGGFMVTPYLYYQTNTIRVINRNVTKAHLDFFDRINREIVAEE